MAVDTIRNHTASDEDPAPVPTAEFFYRLINEDQFLRSPSRSSKISTTTTLPQMKPNTPQRQQQHQQQEQQEQEQQQQQQQQHSPNRVNPYCQSIDRNWWRGPAKTVTVVNGLTFRSDFDSGNLMKVIMPAEQGGVGGEYQLWTARDCEGGPNPRRNSSWFHFGVAGGSKKQIITMRLMNLNNQNALYKHGMTPVFRVKGNPEWARLKQKVTFEEEGRHLRLQFQFRFIRDLEEVFFAFCFPHSYEECQRDLEISEDQARRDGMAVQALLKPKPGSTGYLHRELLTRTPEGRRVDLITLTDCHGIMDEREPRIDSDLFPEFPSRRRPFEFEGKDIVFVSARVHPGETPASFVLQGILRFLLDAADPRAAELRRRFIFKLVPLLNPDGVAAGHFRQDSYGNNLNRHYADPHPEIHASVYAAKAVVMHHAARPLGRGRLTLYLDLHAHASARGCFMYGNHLPGLEDQAENQLLPLLMTLNTPHFDFASCNFSLKHMSRVDSGDDGLSAEGTGRVFYGRHAGVLRSYTLECNYNTGKAMCNHVPPANGARGGRFASPERKATAPPRYHPDMWRDVGRGFLKALLDAEGAMVWSRLPQSKFKSLERARRFLVNELRSQPSYREQSLVLRRGSSATTAPPLPIPPHKAPRRTPSTPISTSSSTPPLSARNPETVTPATIEISLKVGGIATPRTIARRGSQPPPLLPTRPGKISPAGGGSIASKRSGSGDDCGLTTKATTGIVKSRESPKQHCRSSRERPVGRVQTGTRRSSAEGTRSCSRSVSRRRHRGRVENGRVKGGERQSMPSERCVLVDGGTRRTMSRRKAGAGRESSSGGGGSGGGNDSTKGSSRPQDSRNSSSNSSRNSSNTIMAPRRSPRHGQVSRSITINGTHTPPEIVTHGTFLSPSALGKSCTAVATASKGTPVSNSRRIRQHQQIVLPSKPCSDDNCSGLQQPAPGWELKTGM